jgi:hypothetical protein
MRTLIDAQRNHDAAKRCRANAFAVRLALSSLEKTYGKNTLIRTEYERTIAGLESEADEYDRLAARITRDYAGAIQECA